MKLVTILLFALVMGSGTLGVISTTAPPTATSKATPTMVKTTPMVPTTKTTPMVPTTKTTSAVPTTTAVPTVPPPDRYAVKDSANKTCILAQFLANFTGEYTNATSNATVPFLFKMPENAEVSQELSMCGSDSTPATMVLTFEKDTFELEFTKAAKAATFQLTFARANLTHSPAHFPDSDKKGEVVSYGGKLDSPAFSTSLGNYFSCQSTQSLKFKSKFAIVMKDIKLQPFGDAFDKVSMCEADTPTVKPAVPAAAGNWTVNDTKGNVCMRMSFAAEYIITYTTEDNKMATVGFILPNDTLVDTSSTCSNSSATFVLSFVPDKDESAKKWQTSMVFEMDKDNNYALTNFSLMYTMEEKHFPNVNKAQLGKEVTAVNNTKRFITGSGSYYMCTADQSFNASQVQVTISKMKVQPFAQMVDDHGFGSVSMCEADTPTVKPAVPAAAGNWTVNDTKGNVCMRMSFAAEYIITYTTEDNKMAKVGFILPNDTLVDKSSTCSNSSATFVLSFVPDKDESAKKWQTSMIFEMDKDKKYALTNFSLMYTMEEKHFPNVNKTQLGKEVTAVNNTKRFSTGSGSYYMCTADQSFNASQVQVTISKMKVQPFAQMVDDHGFGSVFDCAADNTISNIVPIAVGCALAALVIIVLIAYLIGRSRTKRSGYQSV